MEHLATIQKYTHTQDETEYDVYEIQPVADDGTKIPTPLLVHQTLKLLDEKDDSNIVSLNVNETLLLLITRKKNKCALSIIDKKKDEQLHLENYSYDDDFRISLVALIEMLRHFPVETLFELNT